MPELMTLRTEDNFEDSPGMWQINYWPENPEIYTQINYGCVKPIGEMTLEELIELHKPEAKATMLYVLNQDPEFAGRYY